MLLTIVMLLLIAACVFTYLTVITDYGEHFFICMAVCEATALAITVIWRFKTL